jgi:hypothetical protein
MAVDTTLAAVEKYAEEELTKDDVEFTVELAKPAGFRLVCSSRSCQKRRKLAASVIKDHRDEIRQKLNLHVQYDKPWALRVIQKTAHKFLGGLKRKSGGRVHTVEAKQGMVYVNGVRAAPEYLIPPNEAGWEALVDEVLGRVDSWKGRVIPAPETGALFELFAAFYAADKGVYDLDAIPLEEYNPQPAPGPVRPGLMEH